MSGLENVDLSLVDWSRGQFALTAIYHWLFVPLTLGITFLIAIMETIYVKTGDPEWKRLTKFWMKLFGINFAIGVATGLILEFEFGTNWSNYSWFVGDIFGAPLAIEGIMAFFMESTFIAVMFFGWNKVSKKFHLLSTWLVALGSNLSALWILVANAWMQHPVGMHFNPDTARNEMLNFWEVFLSPVAINKFLHTITSGYLLASAFVIGVSAWFLLRGREVLFAKRSIIIAAVFGLIWSSYLAFTGDGSAYEVAQKQPMKLAAMEGLYEGKEGAGLIAIGVLKPGKEPNDGKEEYLMKIEIPGLLSLLGYRDANAFVPGVEDIINGGYPSRQSVLNEDGSLKDTILTALSAKEKIIRGKLAIANLKAYREAKKAGDAVTADSVLQIFRANYAYMGYGYLTDPNDLVPHVPMVFYSFHIMVMLGFFFILIFFIFIYKGLKNRLTGPRWLLRLSVWSIALAYIATIAGWIVAEMGRQPWVIQDLMPTVAAVSNLSAGSVKLTFALFAVTFTALLIAEVKIMTSAIKKGPDPVSEPVAEKEVSQ